MKIARMVAGSFLIASLGLGCAELITYSNKANEQGQKLFDEGRYDEAAGAFRNATQQNPRAYHSFFMLGQSYDKLGREQQALQSYHAAVDVMPNPPKEKEDIAFRDQAVDGLANCIAKAASKEAELTAVTDKANRTGTMLDWYVVARTQAAIGDADGAIDAYDRAMLAGGGNDAYVAKSFGLYLAQIGQTKRAEAQLTKAYQLKPDDAQTTDALRKLGVVPGPSLLTEDQLHKPLMPKGPIPEIQIHDKNKPATPAE